jgi:hypothetical protein
MIRKALFFSLLSTLVMSGCRLRDKEWDLNVLVPLAHADITTKNLVKDSIIRKNADNTLTLVNVQTLKSLNISDFLKIPDTTFQKNVSLKQIQLGTRVLKKNITLGYVAKSSGLTGAIIIGSNGKKLIVPPISNLATPATPIDAQSFFKQATFVDGYIDLHIGNGFPIELTNIKFKITNSGDTTAIFRDYITSIKPHAEHVSTYALAGKTVQGSLIATIESMSSPGSSPDSVLIDTTNAITILMKAYGMSVSQATAIFPAQYLVNDKLDIQYNLRGPEFKSFIIRSGNIKFTSTSTIHDSMYLHYAIPGATKNGLPVVLDITVPPSGSSASTITKTLALDGYNVDLTGQYHNSLNTFYNILTLHLDSTGRLETLALKDSIFIFYGLFNVIPEYAKGYLGTKTYTVGPEYAAFDIFKNISVNKLTIPKLKVNLQISNGVGAQATGKINAITAYNSKTKQSVVLTSGSIINTNINISAATDHPLKPAVVNIPLDNTNSNINRLLEILPDQFLYQMEFTIDPNGNSSNYNDFIYYESNITANLNIEMPLEFGATGLVLQDTIAPDFGTTDLSRVKDGVLHIKTTNDYPLEAVVQLYIVDQNNRITDSLINTSANIIPAGNGDPNNLISGKGIVNVSISPYQWQQIISKKKLIFKATLKTANAQVVKIFSNNHIKASITGDFRYRNALK